MGKRGFYNQAMTAAIIIGVLIAIMVCYWFWSLIAPSATSLTTDVSSIILNQARNSTDGNISNAANLAITPAINVLGDFEFFTYTLLSGAVMGFLLLCFYVRTYPFLLFFWIIGIFILALTSIWLTSSYEGAIAGAGYFSTTTTSWTTNHYIMSNLPSIFVGFGIIGGIILFLIVSRETEAEVQAL